MAVNLAVLKCRPSELNNDKSRTKWEEANAWKSSTSMSDFYDNNESSQIHRHYDNRYSHRRHNLVSYSKRCIFC